MFKKRVVMWVSLIAIALAGCSPGAAELTPPEDIQVVRLTFNEGWSDHSPVWSPNGDTILFTSRRVQESENVRAWDLYIMNPDGSGQRRLTDTTEGIERISAEGSWSPDGAQIAAAIRYGYGLANNPIKIYTIPVIEEGSAPISFEEMELLVDFGDLFNATDPAWSPGGDKLAFHYGSSEVLVQGGGNNIAVLDLKSGEITKVTDENQMYAFDLSWSPDNETITFAADPLGDEEIKFYVFLLEVSTGQITQMTFNDEDKQPAWSPDGRWIVYTGVEQYLEGIYLINVHTGKTFKLFEDTEKHQYIDSPTWSPDGRWIVFSARLKNEHMDIYLLDMSWLEMVWKQGNMQSRGSGGGM